MRSRLAKEIALGGMLAAAAVVIFCLGGMIPVATYVCPALAIIVCQLVKGFCGNRIAWAWYGAVAFLAVMICPDKEASALFVFLGYYPMLKALLDRLFLPLLWKLLYFNVSILIFYCGLVQILGLWDIAAEYQELGAVGLGVTLFLGNVVFFLLDYLLGRRFGGKGGSHG